MASPHDDAPGSRTFALCVLALVIGVSGLFFALVGDYGPGYDELIGDFQYGERSWYFLRTWDSRYLDLVRPLAGQTQEKDASSEIDKGAPAWTPPPSIDIDGHRDLYSIQLEAPYVHGHGAALGSAITCWFFFRTLDVLPAVDAHHAVNLLFALALVLVLFSQVSRALGLLAALLAVALWFAQPHLFAHWFFNVKDFPEVCLFGLTILVFWRGWWPRRRTGMLVLAAALWGFALSVKVNAVFVPVILLAWIWITRNRRREIPAAMASPRAVNPPMRSDGVRNVKLVLLLLVVSAASFYSSWPYLWLHPKEFLRHVEFVISRGQADRLEFSLSPLVDWLTATPEIVLVGSLFGILFAFFEPRRRDRRSFLLLVALWYAVPLVRANLPGMRHYDVIRHFLEITVPAAILASYGWLRVAGGFEMLVARWLKPAWPRIALRTAAVVLVLAATAWSFRGLHPYELAYFNKASGGLKAARERGHPDAGDYWAASYRQGVRWMNANLPPGSFVAVPFAEHLVTLTRDSRDGLRFDLRPVYVTGPLIKEAGEVVTEFYSQTLDVAPVYVMYVPRESWTNNVIRHAERLGEQVFPNGEVDTVTAVPSSASSWRRIFVSRDGTVDGAPVLRILKVPQRPPRDDKVTRAPAGSNTLAARAREEPTATGSGG